MPKKSFELKKKAKKKVVKKITKKKIKKVIKKLTKQEEKLKKIVDSLPKKTGVYQMKNKNGETIYVGKANDLKVRLKDHFFGSSMSPSAHKLRSSVEDVEFTEVTNEVEALVLEANLIKKIQPKFNVLLRDDKSFLFIKVSVQDDFPQVTLTRRPTKDGAKYFGPKTKAGATKRTVDLLQRIFKFRTCNYNIFEISEGNVQVKKSGSAKLPCLEAHIQKCDAPCIGKISKEEYRSRIDATLKFLKGDSRSIEKELEENMKKAAIEKNFEHAAKWRDLLLSVRNFTEKQIAAEPGDFEADVIAGVEKVDHAFFHLFQIRDGRIIGSEDFVLPMGENLAESLFAFLREHISRATDLPNTFILDREIFSENEKENWESFVQKTRYKKQNIKKSSFQIMLPQKGKRNDLLQLAKKNAENYAKKNTPKFLKDTEKSDYKNLQKELVEKLNLPNKPKRIECYDISHLSGTETVGSMVVFKNGEAKNDHYRKFKIRSLKNGEIDDFKAINEVIFRRFKNMPIHLGENTSFKRATEKDFEYIKEQIEKEHLNAEDMNYKQFIVLKKENKIAGFAREKLYDDGKAHLIASLFIAPEFRGRKLSKSLIMKLVQVSKVKKFYAIVFGKKKFVDFLRRMGFEDLKKVPEVLIKRTKRASKQHGRDMMNEASFLVYQKRKFDQSFEQMPDLLLIDGGKGQLKAAVDAIHRFKNLCKIPICAIAKKEEEIFIPGKKKPVSIKKDSPVGLFLQRVRDEAHRFAVTFNRDLRSKKDEKSVLDEISGIGPETKNLLLQKFGSVAEIRNATDEELKKIVSRKIVELLREKL